MKRFLAAAFLSGALLAPRAAFAQVWNEKTQSYDYVDDKGNVQGSSPASDKPASGTDKPAAGTDKPAGEAAPGGDAKYGTFALDAAGNKVTGEALSKLPPEAQWAMKEKGYSPVLGPNGEVLGYDNGSMCILPDAVGKDYAAAAKGAMLPPGVQGPCPAAFPSCHSPEANQQQPPLVAAANISDMLGGRDSKSTDPKTPEAGQNFCDANPGRPPCAPVENPEDKAARDIAENQKKAGEAADKGDREGAIAAINDARKAEDESEKRGSGSGPAFGISGTDIASEGPGPSGVGSTGGGQGIGAQGQVGGGNPGGSLAGKRVRATAEQEADALIAFQQGMRNGSLQGPSDPNVRSVAQVAQQGLGGRALEAAKSIFASLSGTLEAATADPNIDNTAGLATSPGYDAARTDQETFKVVECKKDTLDGLAGGRTSRRVGGC